MIPPPRNALFSYHYGKRYNLDLFSELRIIGDSGAFSAHRLGAEVTTAQLAGWADQWRDRLCWVAALDVIGDAQATRRNWLEMVELHGVPGVPTIHFGGDPSLMDYYAERGVDFLGLGGLVGRPIQRQLRWLVSVFRYARDRWPGVRFHGWGITHPKALRLPFFSVDSTGWLSGNKYGRLTLRHPVRDETFGIDLNGRNTYSPEIAVVLRDHYGINPSEVSTSGVHNRTLMLSIQMLSTSVAEQRFRRIHGKVAAPRWGSLNSRDAVDGPHLHLAMDAEQAMKAVTLARTVESTRGEVGLSQLVSAHYPSTFPSTNL